MVQQNCEENILAMEQQQQRHMAREDCISHDYTRTIEFLKNRKAVITKADKGNITIASLKVMVEHYWNEHLQRSKERRNL